MSNKIREVGQGYFHSNPLSGFKSVFGDYIYYDLFDWGLIGAISEAPMLLIGDTDRGKTDFAKIIMTALFGEEENSWHKTNIDLDFGTMTYSGTDFSSINEGKNSDELFYEKAFLKYPGLVWDEPNRAPAKLLNKLIHILEKDFHLENGKKVLSGKEYKKENGQKERYQYHILAMNEGPDYHGTSMVDRALRRRQTIEIPIDVFPTTMYDKKQMGEKRTGTLKIKNGEGHFEEVVNLLNSLANIPISHEAEQLKLYFQSMSYCEGSLTKTKKGINFGEHICTSKDSRADSENTHRENSRAACHYLASYPKRMCPNVYGITDGVSIRFGTIARAHALVRALKTLELIARYIEAGKDTSGFDFKKMAAKNKINSEFYENLASYTGLSSSLKNELVPKFTEKYINELKVEPCDFYSVLPFISFSKLELNPHWVEKEYQGSKWFAIKDMSKLAYDRITEFQRQYPEIFSGVVNGDKLSPSQAEDFEESCKNDIWLKQSLAAYNNSGLYSGNTNYETVLGLLR